MNCIRSTLVGFAAAAVLLSGSVAAEIKPDADKAAPPAAGATAAAPSRGHGVIESVLVDPVPIDDDVAPMTASATGGMPVAPDGEKTVSASPRFHFRVRLDDGRYQGFHQTSGDELRIGDRVQVEIDRLHRAPEQDQLPK
jgi:hypothetical protein